MPTQTIEERSESWPENVSAAELRENLSSYRNTGVFARNKNAATPYKFYIRPFPNSFTIRLAIQDNGGSIIKYKDVKEADFIIKSMQHAYMNDTVSASTPECSARLIIDSLEAGELLDYRDYVVASSSSSSSDEEEVEDTRTERIDDDEEEEEEDGQFNPNEGPISTELLMSTPPQATTKTPQSNDSREKRILVDTTAVTSSAERRSFVEETPSNSNTSAKPPGSSAAKGSRYLNPKVDEALEPDDQYTDNFLSSQSRSFAELATDAAQSREDQEMHSAVISDNDYRVESLLDYNSWDICDMAQNEIAEQQETFQDDARTTVSSNSLLGRATGMVVRLARNAFSYSSPSRGDDEHFVQQLPLNNKAKSDLAALENNQGRAKEDKDEETAPIRRDYSESRLGKRRRISQISAEEDMEVHTVSAGQTQSAPMPKSQNALLDQLVTTSTSRQARRRTGPLSQAFKQRRIGAHSLSPEFTNRRKSSVLEVTAANGQPRMKSPTEDGGIKPSTIVSPSVRERASQIERRITRSSEKTVVAEKEVVELMDDTESDDLPSASELIYSKTQPAPSKPEEDEESEDMSASDEASEEAESAEHVGAATKAIEVLEEEDEENAEQDTEMSVLDDVATKSDESNVEPGESTEETGVATESLILEDPEVADVLSQKEGESEEEEEEEEKDSEYDEEEGSAEEGVFVTDVVSQRQEGEVPDKVLEEKESDEEEEDSDEGSEDPELPTQDTPMKAVDEESDREDQHGDAASEETLDSIKRDALDVLMDDNDSENEPEQAIPVYGSVGNTAPQQVASAPSNKLMFTPENAGTPTVIHGGARTLPPPDRASKKLPISWGGLTLCERLKRLNTKMVQDPISTLPTTFDNNQRPLSPPSFQEPISHPSSPSHRSTLSGTSRVYGGDNPEMSDIEQLQYIRKLKGLIMDTAVSATEALNILYRVTGNWVYARVLIIQGEQAVPGECLWDEADDQTLLNGVNLAKIADLRERKGDVEVYRRTQFLNTYYSPIVQ